MAIKADIKRHRMTLTDAYITVEPHTLGKELLGFRMKVFSDEDDAQPLIVEDMTCPYALDGPNPWVQAYDWLKTQPEFAVADDLLAEKAKPVLPERREQGPQAGSAEKRKAHPDKVR